MSDTKITYYRGDSYPKIFTIKDANTNQVIDLTGYTFIMTVNSLSSPPDDSTEIFFVPGVVDDPALGMVAFTPTSENNNITAVTYYYDVQMVSGSIKELLSKMIILLLKI